MSISAQIRIRRDTAANFTSANPTLALGEIAYETDTFRFKVGTGSTAWTALGYAAQNPTSLTVTDSTASTSTTTGALRVTGGVGIGGAVNAGSDAVFNGVRIGRGAALETTTRVGNSAGAVVTSGTAHSTFIGKNAGLNTTGSFNTAVGSSALETNTGTELNVAVGFNALKLISGTNNVAVGSDAGSSNTSGNNNTLLGHNAGRLGAAQSNVVAVGYFAANRNQANDTVAVGLQSLQSNTLGTANVSVGRSALSAATTAIATVTTTDAGTGGTDGAKTAIQLERDSGGTMATYPTVDLTVSGGAVSGTVTVATGGSGSTSNTAGGIIFRANAAGIAAGVPANWRCQLQTVSTAANNTAVGHQAGLSLTTGSSVTAVGSGALDACTTGSRNIGIGTDAWGGLTAGSDNLQISVTAQSGRTAATTGNANVIVGNTSAGITSGSRNTIIGAGQIATQNGPGHTLTTGSRNIIIGHGDVAASSTDDSIFIGSSASNVVNDGSGTTVIGTTATTQARIRGATFLSTGANGQSTQLGQSTTLLSGLTGATVTATNLIPANSILLGVTARVTTAITGATTFDIGDGVTADRFGNDVAIALNTTSNQVIAPAAFAAANNVVLTANGSNFTGGAVRLTAHFMTLVAPTS